MLVRLQKANYAVVFSLVSTIRAAKLERKLTATTFTKIASPQINCNMKETSLRLYEKEPVLCKLQELFRSGLNEMK